METFKPYVKLFKSKIVLTSLEKTQQEAIAKENSGAFFLTSDEPKAEIHSSVLKTVPRIQARRNLKLSRGILSIVLQFLLPKQIRLRLVNKQFKDIYYEFCMLRVEGPKM